MIQLLYELARERCSDLLRQADRWRWVQEATPRGREQRLRDNQPGEPARNHRNAEMAARQMAERSIHTSSGAPK